MINLPITCPFCDELAYKKKGYKQIALPHKIYTPRKCIMGHEFYSVEEVPENQSEIVAEIREIRKEAKEWRKTVIEKRAETLAQYEQFK